MNDLAHITLVSRMACALCNLTGEFLADAETRLACYRHARVDTSRLTQEEYDLADMDALHAEKTRRVVMAAPAAKEAA